MHLASLYQGCGAEGLRHRSVERLRSIEDDEQTAVGPQPAALADWSASPDTRSCSPLTLPRGPAGVWRPFIEAQRHDDAVAADVDPIDQ